MQFEGSPPPPRRKPSSILSAVSIGFVLLAAFTLGADSARPGDFGEGRGTADGLVLTRNDGNTTPAGEAITYGAEGFDRRNLEARGVACAGLVEPTKTLVNEWQSPDKVVHDYTGIDELRGLEQAMAGCLLACLPSDPDDWTGEAVAAGRDCFDENASEMTVAIGIAPTWDVLMRVLRAWPNLSFFCHTTGHAMGRAAVVEARLPVVDVLRAVGHECIGGALHGATDGLTELGDLAGMEGAAAVCEEREVGGPASSYLLSCADGIGHAAWELTKNLEGATAECGRLSLHAARISCDAGIIMKWGHQVGMYTRPELEGYREWGRQIAELCAAWSNENKRTPVGDEEPGDGCHAGTQYLMWTGTVLAIRNNYAGDWRKLDGLTDRFGIWADTCASYGVRGERLCREAEGVWMLSVGQFDEDDTLGLCKDLPDKVTECLETVKTHLKTVESSPG